MISHNTTALQLEHPDVDAHRGECAPPVDHGTRLDLSRRIDWRFLLPDPRLETVACLGCEDDALRNALPLFSQSVVFFRDAADNFEPGPRFDLVVACDPDQRTIESAAALLRPGGFLYCEVRRSMSGLSTWSRTPRRTIACFERIGFRDVCAHWHWPNFTDCNAIVPVNDDGAAVRFFLDQQGTGLAQRCKSAVGRAVLAAGLLDSLIGCYSVLGRGERPER